MQNHCLNGRKDNISMDKSLKIFHKSFFSVYKSEKMFQKGVIRPDFVSII